MMTISTLAFPMEILLQTLAWEIIDMEWNWERKYRGRWCTYLFLRFRKQFDRACKQKFGIWLNLGEFQVLCQARNAVLLCAAPKRNTMFLCAMPSIFGQFLLGKQALFFFGWVILMMKSEWDMNEKVMSLFEFI